jgi:hypothetical protein
LISPCGIPQTPYLYNLSIRMLCSVQSNAFYKSNSTQLHFVLSFRCSIMFSIIVAIASFVDLFFLNPNWDLLSILCLSMKGISCLAVTFSRTFERTGTRVTGW